MEFEVSKHGKRKRINFFKTILIECIALQAHNKGINALIMLPEGTLLSGGDKDRKIIAWDSLQNYNKITETKV